jgi:restriction system protein
MAKKSALFEDLFYIASKLPWWISAAIALGSGVYLHAVATAPVAAYTDVSHLQSMMLSTVGRTAAGFGQYLLPIIFTAGAIASIFAKRKRRQLFNSVTTPGGHTLGSISWREFELLVGEALRRRGYSILETGGSGPDGGVDLIARKDGEKYLVQCKQWRAMQVGVPVVRELYGAMAAEGAVGGFVVTSGTFSKPARDFASGRNVQLVDGAALQQWMNEAKKPGPRPTVEVVPEPVGRVEPVLGPAVAEPALKEVKPAVPVEPKAPACPHCRKTMVVRMARSGANAGGNFWGCADYPKCRGMRRFTNPMGTL